MSIQADPTRRSTTTYSQLTGRAARCIARAGIEAVREPTDAHRVGRGGPCPRITISPPRSCTSAGTLAKPLGNAAAAPARRRRGGPDARLIRALEAGGAASPAGMSPRPRTDQVRRLPDAARPDPDRPLISGPPTTAPTARRAAPRRPGCDTPRPWAPRPGSGAHSSRSLRRLPTPWQSTVDPTILTSPSSPPCARSRGRGGRPPARSWPRRPLDVTVARPGIRPGQPPLDELSERVARLRLPGLDAVAGRQRSLHGAREPCRDRDRPAPRCTEGPPVPCRPGSESDRYGIGTSRPPSRLPRASRSGERSPSRCAHFARRIRAPIRSRSSGWTSTDC